MSAERILEIVRNRKVLFITPSDVDYIRNRQEIGILQSAAKELDIIAPANTHTVTPTGLNRIIRINLRVLFADLTNYDVIFVAGIPQMILPLVYLFLKKKTVVIDFFISIYDTIVSDRQLLSPGNPLSALLKKLDRRTLKLADHVIVDTREHASYFSEFFGVDERRIEVIYLEPDRTIYYPRHVERPENLQNKFIAFFFGAMNPLQGVEMILEAARLLQDHEDIEFVFVGPHEKIAGIEKYSELPNVRFVARWLPQDAVADYIAQSDVCLAGHFNAEIPKASRVIPGKAYSYLAMDKPVILGDNPANRELFSEGEKKVHFVRMGDPEALANRILRLVARKRG